MQNACNLRYKDAYTICYICHAKCKNAQKKAIHMLQRTSHTPNSRNQTHTKLPPANEWKLLDLGVWWKYRLVGHVWVHGSRLSSLSLHCPLENDTSLLCAWFWNEALGSLQHLWPWCCHIEVEHGYPPHQSHHGVCDPKELRATTSYGNILCLGSGLSNTRLFAGRSRHQRRSQKLACPEVDFLSNRHPAKSASEKPWSVKEEEVEYKRTKLGVLRKYLKIRFTACWCEVLGDAWKRAHRHTENWMSASSPSGRGVTWSCSGTPSGPRVHLPHPHQEL
jgi:hypothetical protein